MMRKALTVYQTYVEMMNDDIRKVRGLEWKGEERNDEGDRVTQIALL